MDKRETTMRGFKNFRERKGREVEKERGGETESEKERDRRAGRKYARVGRGTQKQPMYRAQHIVDLFLDYSPSFYLAREFLYARFSARERHSCARCLLRLSAPGRSSVIYDRETRRNFISPVKKIERPACHGTRHR